MKPYEIINPDRFFAKVDKSPGQGVDGDCQLWTGPRSASGAGLVTAKQGSRTVNFKAHRVAHWLHYGLMPDHLYCVHACDEPACCNPRHLYLSDRKKGIAPARIMRAIDVTPGQGPTGECWEFRGAREPKMGYGIFVGDERNTVPAHRYMFDLVCGPIPEGQMVLHRCDNAACCNPAHLYLGDHAQNMADRGARGRTARTRGHFKIDEATAIAIKRDSRKHADIAASFGVSRSTVSFIKAGKRWVNIPA